jgi:uncharacterized protein
MKVALIIMAKAPEPGFAKTRLIPVLGAEGAAELANRLLMHTMQTAAQTHAFVQHELCLTPDPGQQAFDAHFFEQTSTWHLQPQGDGDLGQRMQRAFARALSEHDAAVLIGTDAPSLTAQQLDQAAHDLAHHEAVFVPAIDGGYALIGLKQPMPELFNEMPWSTSTVMAATLSRLQTLGVLWHAYEPIHDIDEPADLIHLPHGWLT